jgi:allantoinase
LAHAELPGPIDDAAKRLPANAPRQVYKTWLDSHPSAAEDEAIALLLRLGREYDTHIHIVHLASASALPQIQCAKSSGARLTIETCPHYLTFSAEDISDGATQFKCAPPIRDAVNREELWSALRNGTVDMIATDHSPCPPQMKQLESGDFLAAWGGIASLQLSLPAVWTEARSRGYSLTHLAKWLCECPAQLAGLAAKKGAIAIGRDADLVIWNPDATFHVDPASLYHRYKLTPYAGRELFGTVESTFLRGTNIYDHGTFRTMHTGQVLLRGKL